MLIASVDRTPTLTRERYETVVFELTGKRRASSPDDFPFDGLLMHVAAEGPNGFIIFDVLESKEAIERFGETAAIAKSAGIEEPPPFFPLHTYFAAGSP